MLALTAPAIPWLFGQLIDESFIQSKHTVALPLFLVGIFVVKGLLEYFNQVFAADLSFSILTDLRLYVFGSVMERPYWDIQALGPGALISRMTYDINQIGVLFSRTIVTMFKESMVLIALLIFLLWTSWFLTIILLCVAPLLFVIVRALASVLHKKNKELQLAFSHVSGLAQQALHNITDVKIFFGHEDSEKRFRKASDDLFLVQMDQVRVAGYTIPLTQVIAATAVAVVIMISSPSLESGSFTPGEFISFIGASALLPDTFRKIVAVVPQLEKGLVGTESLIKLTEYAGAETQNALRLDYYQFGNDDQLTGINVQAISGRSSALNDPVSFDLKIGEILVLEGPSGSGKSSVANALLGFSGVSEGTSILLNGSKLSGDDLIALRSQISYLGQDSKLISGSLFENLRIGNPSLSRSQAKNYLKNVGLYECVSHLPDGIDTILSAHSVALSGGQIQRLLLARVLAKEVPIVILDEPTSALDDYNKKVVFDLIFSLDSKAVILITHDDLPSNAKVKRIALKALSKTRANQSKS